MLGTLLVDATKTGGGIFIDKALTYLLTRVCAPLCTADRNRTKTKKSDLFSVLEDMETTKLLNSIPSSYDTVYVACDTYGEASTKSAEFQIRGDGKKCLFKNLT